MKVISFATNKGGVGKTACTFQIGCRLSMLGKKVLLIDMDGQASLTRNFNIDPEGLQASVHDALIGRISTQEAIIQLGFLHLLPSQRRLSTSAAHLNDHKARQFLLLKAINTIRDQYDFILIDTPPAIDILNTNAIVASDAVIGVSMPDTSSTYGITSLIQFLNEIREIPNISPTLIGIIANGYDSRNKLDQKIFEQLNNLKNESGASLAFETPIRHTVAIPECYAAGKNIFDYKPDSPAASDFIKITDEILQRVQ